MKVLITGATGQVGSYMVDYLLDNQPEVEVHCTKRWRSDMLNAMHFEDKVTWHECDLTDFINTYEVISEVMPDRITHFAAQSYVAASFHQPFVTLETNIKMYQNILESILIINDKLGVKRGRKDLVYNPKIHVALSSEEYGLVKPDEVPINESNELRPLSQYGISKITKDFLAYQYHQSYGMNTFGIRSFNHDSARRGDKFVTGSFCRQIVEIEKGLKEPILKVGNISSIRDWTPCQDVVQGIWLGLEKCEAGTTYNICSNKGYTIKQFIERLFELTTYQGNIEIKVDPTRLRPSDVDRLIGDNTEFCKVTGWKPKIDFMAETVPQMLQYWRKRLDIHQEVVNLNNMVK